MQTLACVAGFSTGAEGAAVADSAGVTPAPAAFLRPDCLYKRPGEQK